MHTCDGTGVPKTGPQAYKFALNSFPEAEQQGRKAITIKPNFSDAHVLRGNTLLRHRKGHWRTRGFLHTASW